MTRSVPEWIGKHDDQAVPQSIVGMTFGKLLVLLEAPRSESGQRRCMCVCECNRGWTGQLSNLRSGHTKSCGCLAIASRVKHGKHRAAEYQAWRNMKSRCYNPKTPLFANHGGRGIRVCDEWLGSFDTFLFDVGLRPSIHHSLDRIDNEQGYSPQNCRWATRKQQMRNTRASRRVCVEGETMSLRDAVERFSRFKYNTVLCRLLSGWSIEEALHGKVN